MSNLPTELDSIRKHDLNSILSGKNLFELF